MWYLSEIILYKHLQATAVVSRVKFKWSRWKKNDIIHTIICLFALERSHTQWSCKMFRKIQRAYSEPSHKSKTEFCENSSVVNYFRKTLYLRCFIGFWIRFLKLIKFTEKYLQQRAWNFKKRLKQCFQFFQIFQNTFFTKHIWITAFG